MRNALIAAVLALAASPALAADAGLEQTATRFLDAWARGDKAALASLTARDGDLHMYGSDAAEFMAGRAAIERLMEADQKLWRGLASFEGPLRNVSSVEAGGLATLFFDRTFQVGGRTLPIRFATVWRKEEGSWRLVQSSNVAPTTGQSAAELTK